MEKNNRKQKGFGKTLLAAALVIGATTLAFQGLMQVVLAAELGKMESVPGKYQIEFTPPAQEDGAPGGKTAEDDIILSYTLVDNDLEYYRDKKPTNQDISREKAAAVGVKGLEEVFGINLAGKEIEMSFNPANGYYLAYWEGMWWTGGKYKSTDGYYFTVDARSGELMGVSYSRTLEVKTDVGFDLAIENNPQEYEQLAKKTAEQYNAVGGAVKSATYGSQGSAGNDPVIQLEVVGANDKRASLQFSRYDKALLGITYEAGVKQFDAAEKDLEEFQKRSDQYFAEHPDATTYEE